MNELIKNNKLNAKVFRNNFCKGLSKKQNRENKLQILESIMLKQLDYLLKNNENFSQKEKKNLQIILKFYKLSLQKCNEYNKICKHLNYKIKKTIS